MKESSSFSLPSRSIRPAGSQAELAGKEGHWDGRRKSLVSQRSVEKILRWTSSSAAAAGVVESKRVGGGWVGCRNLGSWVSFDYVLGRRFELGRRARVPLFLGRSVYWREEDCCGQQFGRRASVPLFLGRSVSWREEDCCGLQRRRRRRMWRAQGLGLVVGGSGMEWAHLRSGSEEEKAATAVVQVLRWISWSEIGVAAFCAFAAVLIWSQRSGKEGSRRRRRAADDNASRVVVATSKMSDDESSREGSEGEGVVELDAIVVGAGVAGAALAHTLGKDGRRVLVLERDLSEPDRIVGELLQPGGYLKLVALGLQDCVEGIDAQKVLGYALFKDGRDAKVGYPLEGMADDIAGRSFHNGRFIQKMRAKASSLPSVNLQQGTVLSLIEENGTVKGVRYKSLDGKQIEAFSPLTFVCDGCFSNLRRNLCTPQVDVPSCFVGLVLENCDLPHPSHGHVVLADPSPILFYPISGTEVRCLVDVPGQKVPSIANGDMAKYLTTHVAPQLPQKLKEPFIAAVTKGKIRTMPNKSMPAFPRPTPGALLMGDAFNMRHPMTGGGMTVALSDILVLRDMLKPLRDFQDAPALCDYLKAFYTRRKPVASTINTLAGALYKVFCASPDEAMTEMRQACFDYLSLGGVFSTGPVALLSGLNPKPLSLVTHFFAVALFGVGRLMLPFPSLKRMWIGMRLIQGASKIIFPIILAEGVVQMFFPSLMPNYYNAPPQSVNK